MKAVRRWLRARWVLGWALMGRVLLAPWVRRQTDPKRWLRTMTGEGLARTPQDNWAQFNPAGRCIGCGRCDLFGNAQVPRPSHVMVGGARLAADAPAWRTQAAALRALAPQIRQICPTGADAAAVADIIERNAIALHAP